MPAAAIIALVIDGITAGIDGFRKVLADLQQQGELSDQEAADLTQRMESAFASPAWQPDAQREAVADSRRGAQGIPAAPPGDAPARRDASTGMPDDARGGNTGTT